MRRYFVAIPLPDACSDQLAAILSTHKIRDIQQPGARWVRREQLHLTLHFLGELTAEEMLAVQQRLSEMKFPAFALTVQGVGVFPSRTQPRVLWAGVEPNPDLHALHATLGEALQQAFGFQVEARPYIPHITLARATELADPEVIRSFLQLNSSLRIPEVVVTEFVFYESQLSHNAPHYRRQATVRL